MLCSVHRYTSPKLQHILKSHQYCLTFINGTSDRSLHITLDFAIIVSMKLKQSSQVFIVTVINVIIINSSVNWALDIHIILN